MPKRRKNALRRSTIAIALSVFLFVAAVVVWRRSMGVAGGREMAQLQKQLRELETEIKSLERDIREASSNRVVVAKAERLLGMHVASETQVRSVMRDTSRSLRE